MIFNTLFFSHSSSTTPIEIKNTKKISTLKSTKKSNLLSDIFTYPNLKQ